MFIARVKIPSCYTRQKDVRGPPTYISYDLSIIFKFNKHNSLSYRSCRSCRSSSSRGCRGNPRNSDTEGHGTGAPTWGAHQVPLRASSVAHAPDNTEPHVDKSGYFFIAGTLWS